MPDIQQLSERELEILQFLATGASNKKIAKSLVISVNTVKVHLRNIYAKLEVSSRTEATLVAVRAGLVESFSPEAEIPEDDQAPTQENQPAEPLPSPWNRRTWLIFGVVAVLLIVIAFGSWRLFKPQTQPVDPPQALLTEAVETPEERWQTLAALPTSRVGFASATYGNQIYVIAGESSAGVLDTTERYDIGQNLWQTLTSKELPVTDVAAVVIGGKIYVPGGLNSEGQVMDILEVYDPSQNEWLARAEMPQPRSAYALATLEGKLYLFGGWDGMEYTDTVFIYDPAQDEWQQGSAMPSARGYAGAAAAGGKIYVIGGFDGEQALAVNEEYWPVQDVENEIPWRVRTPLPEPRYQAGVTSIAELIHVIGGKGDFIRDQGLVFVPTQDNWQPYSIPVESQWSQFGLVSSGTYLYLLGGQIDGEKVTTFLQYRAVYTVMLPIQ